MTTPIMIARLWIQDKVGQHSIEQEAITDSMNNTGTMALTWAGEGQAGHPGAELIITLIIIV
jgi:hypothetical protein